LKGGPENEDLDQSLFFKLTQEDDYEILFDEFLILKNTPI